MNKAIEYFNSHNISEDTLEKFSINLKNETDHLFEIGFPYYDGTTKYYAPNSDTKRRRMDNSIPNGRPKVFGFDQLPKNGPFCFITGGEKDVMSFHEYGYPAIAFNSETANFHKPIIDELQERFDSVIICYDNDKTGIESAEIRSQQFKLPNMTMPEAEYGKDISDFRKGGYAKSELDKLVAVTVEDWSSYVKGEEDKDKSFFLAGDIIDGKGMPDDREIISGILPAVDVSGFVGSSESGKSLFLLEFLICFATGRPIVGFEINITGKSIYLSLEDNVNSIRKRLLKQASGLTKEELQLVRDGIIFEFSPFDYLKKLESLLSKDRSIKVVVIDPISEVMVGGDLNSTSFVREVMQEIRHVSRKYGVSIIVIHHINKSAAISKDVSKSAITGSHAFEASLRTVFFMQSNKNYRNYLYIVKGNNIKEEWKHKKKRIELSLDADSLTFSRNHSTDKDSKTENNNSKKVEIDWWLIYGSDNQLTTKKIKDRVKSQYDLGDRTIERILAEELGDYKISFGLYGFPDHALIQL